MWSGCGVSMSGESRRLNNSPQNTTSIIKPSRNTLEKEIQKLASHTSLFAHPIFLVIDAYYRSRGDGTIVFRVPELKQNILWYDIEYETILAYTSGV